MTTHDLSQKNLRFAERECRDSSPLYESLAIHISMDDELLEICKVARGGQPIPNLLFGAVHYSLMQGTDHPVKEYYPSMVSDPKPYPESFESFKPFCLTYRNEIESIISSKLVQTNEVRRCTYLYPAFGLVHQKNQQTACAHRNRNKRRWLTTFVGPVCLLIRYRGRYWRRSVTAEHSIRACRRAYATALTNTRSGRIAHRP